MVHCYSSVSEDRFVRPAFRDQEHVNLDAPVGQALREQRYLRLGAPSPQVPDKKCDAAEGGPVSFPHGKAFRPVAAKV
jgi:hypothetical protein